MKKKSKDEKGKMKNIKKKNTEKQKKNEKKQDWLKRKKKEGIENACMDGRTVFLLQVFEKTDMT